MRRVWDAPIRIVHWALVILLGFSWWSAENEMMEWHQRSGLMLCLLILFRIFWGFLGSSTARFGQFLTGPSAVVAYLRSSGPWRGLGHNPIGGWSTIILLILLGSQIVTGLFAVDVDGIESGPLSHLVDFDQGRTSAGIHHLGFDILLILAAVHIVAILVYLFVKKRNLILPMVSGNEVGEGESLVAAPAWRLALALFLSAVLTYGAAYGFQF